MIELITGSPRSGKSYLTVKLILDQYFTYDPQLGDYRKKKGKEDITIITNIEGFQLEHIKLETALEQSGLPYNRFFTKEYQQKISKKYPKIVYAIDECQQYFPDTFKDIDTRFYFEWHGHLGHHIYLITQDRFRTCRAIVSLAEMETRAVKRSLSLAGELKYNIISDGTIIDRKLIKPSKKIFRLYRSQFQEEHKKPGKPFLKWILVPLILVLVFGYVLIKRLTPEEAHADTVQKQSIIKQPVLNQATPPSEIIIKDEYDWITLTGIVIRDNKLYRILDPINNEMIPPHYFPYKLRKVGSRYQARMPAAIAHRLRYGGVPDVVRSASADRQPHQRAD